MAAGECAPGIYPGYVQLEKLKSPSVESDL
jgi:hypothetical protein